jgi:hypothetical protein
MTQPNSGRLRVASYNPPLAACHVPTPVSGHRFAMSDPRSIRRAAIVMALLVLR